MATIQSNANKMTQIGRYEIVSELGRGAMGVVYRASDPLIGRTVAIKTIRLGDIVDPQEHQRLRERLFREARSAGILSHPNIVTVYDIGEQGDMAYIAMEFVNGTTLEHVMRAEGGAEKHVILSVMYETASALDYAHQKGIIHRDVKPANIMINENGAAKIADFGVAKILSQQVTQADLVLGTPSYMSPEQIEAKTLDGRSDQFAMAVIAYELLTGEKPFIADSLPALLFRIVREDPTEPNHLNSSLGPETGQVLAKALAKKAAERYPTCAEFVQALTESLSLHPAWRPLQRGSASSMATVVQPSPPVTGGTVLGQSTTDAGSPAMAPRPGAGRVESPPPPPPTSIYDEATLPLKAPSIEPPAPPPPQAPRPETASPPQAALRPEAAPPPRVRREPVAEQPSQSRRIMIVAAVVVVLVGVGFFVGRALLTSSPEAQPRTMTQTVQPTAQVPAPPPPAPPPPPSQTSAPPATESRPREAPGQSTPLPSSPPAPAPSRGRLVMVEVDSEPSGASVSFDDGASQCTTPCPIELAPGRHVMRLTRPGYRDALRIFNTPQELKHMVRLDQSMGMLAIKSTPSDAQIIINGQARSERTPAILNLPVGKYKIQLRKQGFRDYEEEVDVRDQVTRTIEVSWTSGG